MISFIQVRTWVVGLWVAVSSQATRGSYNCLMEKYQTSPRFSEAQGPKQLFIDRNSLDGNHSFCFSSSDDGTHYIMLMKIRCYYDASECSSSAAAVYIKSQIPVSSSNSETTSRQTPATAPTQGS